MSTVKKRLHVSGLTPAITAKDINSRLLGFGTVHALDGFGAVDGVGQPRKFAYVTLEATEANLARCLNVLSGTTWKGAKLRIGEAKPDFAQRLETEREQAAEAETRPAKRRRVPRGVQGVHADDMSPVDLETVDKHPGWHKTTLSHLIRPIKMRPSHPLPELQTKQKVDFTKKKRKKPTVVDGPTRARVQTIDPRLYGPVHLRENMLDAVVIDTHATKPKALEVRRSPSPASSISDDEVPPTAPIPEPEPTSELRPPSDAEPNVPIDVPDIAGEKSRDLGLLMSMFGEDESQWGGKESIDEDMENGDAPEVEVEMASPSPPPPPQPKSKHKSLKDMFKPHEEEAGFSLLSGLGDLDLDPSFDFEPALAPAPAPAHPSIPIAIPTHTPQQPTSGLVLDSSLPFFFPQPDNPRAKDLFSVARAEGWEFGRSGDADMIRKRWDETKGSLTREWKKRAREAVKARRRRYGAEGEET